ncbi:Clavaminate synthase-like protein [Ceraceosorus guamensis]|uniref:Clavaminate synthase-like protein n=1 Tax=Ceraceosorus guamensis TaxID=1522189 RepID=A0A316W7W8_9BASI|nr:Clavaminate synthase-like protein [Ceraceosorus guamensis]PWN46010.1 Clavaminate synthase-like protein [Ceraceosorus guamensis]
MSLALHSATSPSTHSNDPSEQASARLITGEASYQRKLSIPTRQGPQLVSFPHILQPEQPAVDLARFLQTAKELSQQPAGVRISDHDADQSPLRHLLTAAGGVLKFEKTPLRSAQDFSDFMHNLASGTGWLPHVDKGLMVLRRPHAKNVATANEGPPTQAIGSHNEYGLSSHYPSYIAFFCLASPDKGGQTPIASSLRLYERFESELNAYLQAITKRGIAFAIHHPRGNVEGHVGGNSVFNANSFGPDEQGALQREVPFAQLPEESKRAIVEENVRSLAREGGWDESASLDDESVAVWKRRGYSGHWMPDGSFIVVQRTPGVRIHPTFGVPSYFTNVHTRFIYAGIDKAGQEIKPHWRRNLLDLVREQQAEQSLASPFQLPAYIVGNTTSEDDTPFENEWIEENLRITAEEQVDVSWNVGDVLLIDNLAVQHGRRPWEGDRRLLASLWDSPFLQRHSRV